MAELTFDIVGDLRKLRGQLKDLFSKPFQVGVESSESGGGGGQGRKVAKDIAIMGISIAGVWAILKGFQPVMDFIKAMMGLASWGIHQIYKWSKGFFDKLFGPGKLSEISSGLVSIGATLTAMWGAMKLWDFAKGVLGLGGSAAGGIAGGAAGGAASGAASGGLAGAITGMLGWLSRAGITALGLPAAIQGMGVNPFDAGNKIVGGMTDAGWDTAGGVKEKLWDFFNGLSKMFYSDGKNAKRVSQDEIKAKEESIGATEKVNESFLFLGETGLKAADIWETVMKDMTTSWANFQLQFQKMANIAKDAIGWSAGYFYGMTPEMSAGVSSILTPGGFGTATKAYNPSNYSTPKYSGGAFGSGGTGGLGGIAKGSKNVSDAIVSNGNVIQTSPNDMILAVNKLGMGGSGGSKIFNFYGVTPQEMIDVLKRELGKSIVPLGRM